MEIKFAYGKCVFTRPRIENVDQMVQMMNNENIASMLSAKRRIGASRRSYLLRIRS